MLTLSQINALRSAASSARSNATANEGRVNYDVSDVPVKARCSHSLVGAGDSVVHWGGDTTCHDGNCTMVWCNLLYFRRCGVIFTAGTQRLVILAPQSHGREVLPPCDCEARIASMT